MKAMGRPGRDCCGACGPSASLALGSPCGRPPSPLRGAVVELPCLLRGVRIAACRLLVQKHGARSKKAMVRPERLLRGLRPLRLAGARLALRATAIAASRRCRRTPLSSAGSSNCSLPAARAETRCSVNESDGAPGEIRTPGLLVRSQALYPTELRAHAEGREYYHSALPGTPSPGRRRPHGAGSHCP